jgi:hypothetical protein
VFNYLYKRNLYIPDPLYHDYLHSNSITSIHKQHPIHLLHDKHPIIHLKRLLNVFQLVLVPADKTKLLTIIPIQIMRQEIDIHLADIETYRHITDEEFQTSQEMQIRAVADAIKYFKEPKILVTNYKNRYIYMLPKIHKDLNEWRTQLYHPKMRPIISDVNSITSNLTSFLLPTLQNLERKIQSTIYSSLQVVHALHTKEITIRLNKSPLLCTIDVESLFTRIPLDKLLQIINILLLKSIDNTEHRIKYMEYLNVIITNNTFINNGRKYIQIKGLPMGGKLSGSLANIYLGFLEKEMTYHPGITLFFRYMDDICIIWRKSQEQLHHYVKQLEKIYSLKLVYSCNYHAITFLDLTISSNGTKNQFTTYPFSKRNPLYPLSSSFIKPNYLLEKSVIKGQLLRTWRLSNNDKYFTETIKKFLPFTENKPYLQRAIRQYLMPVQLSTNKWSSNILLCQTCEQLTYKKCIVINKTHMINGKIIATKMPLNCQVENIILLQIKKEECILHSVTSIHIYLQDDAVRNVNLNPIGHYNQIYIQQLLRKHPTIQHTMSNEIQNEIQDRNPPCYIHWIMNRPSKVYGEMNYKRRKEKLLTNFFNSYKKL